MRPPLPSQTGQRNPITASAERLGAWAGFSTNGTNPNNYQEAIAPLAPSDGRTVFPAPPELRTSPYRDGISPIPREFAQPTAYNRMAEHGLQSSPVIKNAELGNLGGYQIGNPKSPIYQIDKQMSAQPAAGTNTGFQYSGTGRNQPPPASKDAQLQPTA